MSAIWRGLQGGVSAHAAIAPPKDSKKVNDVSSLVKTST